MDSINSSAIISVAPMMGYTDRHARFLYRLISSNTELYTEMVTARALLHGDLRYLLQFNPEEHPVVLQLGGSEPVAMAKAAQLAQEAGFDEVNINVGCPSERVLSGAFGACLMKEPDTVVECLQSMQERVDLPVTVKMRTGVDDYDSYQHLLEFVKKVSDAGCRRIIVHARKAWLKGLSPKQNREIPPLQYDRVYQLKTDFPSMSIVINGGIRELNQIAHHLKFVDGVMLGREVVRNPWILAEIEKMYFDVTNNRHAIVVRYIDYIHKQLQQGQPLHLLLRPLYGLSFGLSGARKWRQQLSAMAQGKTNSTIGLYELTDSFFSTIKKAGNEPVCG